MYEKAKKLLENHNYVVKVIKINSDECRVLFPDSKEVVYKIDKDRLGISSQNELWSCPQYAQRLMVASDIVHHMKKIGMSSSLINYYDSNNNPIDGLSSIFAAPSSEEEIVKENFLNTLFCEAVKDGFTQNYEDVAVSHNVYTGYRLLKSFFLMIKILMVGEASWLSTGYSTISKELLGRLFNTGKYEIAELGCYVDPAQQDTLNQASALPWRFYFNQPSSANEEEFRAFNSKQNFAFGEWSFRQGMS